MRKLDPCDVQDARVAQFAGETELTLRHTPLRDGDLEGKDVVGAGRLDALHVVAHPAWCPTGRCLISSSLLTVPLEVVETAVLVDELAEVGELERVLLVRVDGGSRGRPG